MIIVNPSNQEILSSRLDTISIILDSVPAKYSFIAGSFLYSENFGDVDIFVVSRKKNISVDSLKLPDDFDPVLKSKLSVMIIDFNELHSLFYHSLLQSYVSKSFLPKKDLKVTLSAYWEIVNEVVPTILNDKLNFQKNVRSLILHTFYFKTGKILDSYSLFTFISKLKDFRIILEYINNEVPPILNKGMKKSYLKRFFYTWKGLYKNLLHYDAQKILYDLSDKIIGLNNGEGKLVQI